jgi:hypothetical protein
VPKVNAIAERSPGFVWRSGEEAERVRPSAGRSSLETAHDRLLLGLGDAGALPHYVYKTVHGAFYRRGHEWFESDKPRGYVLWWVEAGHIPDIAEARDRWRRIARTGRAGCVRFRLAGRAGRLTPSVAGPPQKTAEPNPRSCPD